jgi:alkanesulfonate monooxygenase SsuD/methylene tetrahydromethanopterin reductase-like flavin-dependent oxidoreductase (luciferase family)
MKGDATKVARSESVRGLKMEDARELGTMMYGTPDQVIAQIRRQYERIGGFDHLLMMMQAGFLDHKRTVRNIELFAREVYPAIKDLPHSMARPFAAAAE